MKVLFASAVLGTSNSSELHFSGFTNFCCATREAKLCVNKGYKIHMRLPKIKAEKFESKKKKHKLQTKEVSIHTSRCEINIPQKL